VISEGRDRTEDVLNGIDVVRYGNRLDRYACDLRGADLDPRIERDDLVLVDLDLPRGCAEFEGLGSALDLIGLDAEETL